ncbi:MAG TPA: SRPBCC family protein [bacterium]|nr:SRPBCC family protein [bacterium]
MKHWKHISWAMAAALLVCSPSLIKAADEAMPVMLWTPPPAGPKLGIHQGMDVDTLAALAESGTLQYFQPRRDKGMWDVVVVMMIHAPADEVWKIATDYPAMCQLLPDTIDQCELVSKEGNQTVMRFKAHTSVLKFSFNMEMTDVITETGPYQWRLDTTEGDLKGRELDLLLVPRPDGTTLAFLRYFGAMRSMGGLVYLTLSLLPDLETPVYASAASYHLRGYRNAAEKLSGYQPPEKPAAIDFAALDPKTLQQLCRFNAGLIRETRDGKIINAMAFSDMAAPQDHVWSVMSDFEHYDSFFPDSATVVEKREGNQVLLHQSVKAFNVLVFSYGFDLHCRYQLEPPRRMAYETIDGAYKGSYGDFTLSPWDNGRRTFVFATIRSAIENDQGLSARIVRSGSFPFDAAVNLFFARDVLNKFKQEVERREGK